MTEWARLHEAPDVEKVEGERTVRLVHSHMYVALYIDGALVWEDIELEPLSILEVVGQYMGFDVVGHEIDELRKGEVDPPALASDLLEAGEPYWFESLDQCAVCGWRKEKCQCKDTT